jgi:hypothetical protein
VKQAVRVWVVAMVALAAALAMACGDDDNDESVVAPTPGAQATVPGGGEPEPTATLTVDAATAIAAGPGVEMDEWADPSGRYSIELPRGWDIEMAGDGDTLLAYFPHNQLAGFLSLACMPGATVEEMMTRDADQLRMSMMGELSFRFMEDAEVAGRPARRTGWAAPLGAVMIERVHTYVEGAGCAWRLTWAEQVERPYGDLEPIHQRVLESFRLNETE